MRQTHTYALMEVSSSGFNEIKTILENAGYEHAMVTTPDGTHLDMQGIALVQKPADEEDELDVIEETLTADGDKGWWPQDAEFQLGDFVEKKTGSEWHGAIVGWYRPSNGILGYAVESVYEKGSVQIYPGKALVRVYDAWPDKDQDIKFDDGVPQFINLDGIEYKRVGR